MKPFHKQRLVTRVLFSWGGCLHETLPQTKTGDPWLFSWGGCLQQNLKDICFSPGACKQRLVTRVLFSWGGCLHETLPQTKTGDPWLFSWGGGVVYMKPFHKQRLVARGCFLGRVVYMKPFHKQRLVARGCFLGGVVYNKFLKIFVSPQGPANKDWGPVCCFGGGWGKNFAETARK